MRVPDALRRSVEQRLGELTVVGPVGGGSINQALHVEVDDRPGFLKHNGAAPPGFFGAEARGLDALRRVSDGPRIPEVIAVHDADGRDDAGEPWWILLEWLEPAPRTRDFGRRLERSLAALHAPAVGGWGWGEDNFIGALPQANGPAATWAEFWRDRRLLPQIEMARDQARLPGRDGLWDRLLDRLPDALAAAEAEGPSLLHGDLWSGNVLCTGDCEPALVDPAVYRGHREVDLAMAELFGGFGMHFHAAYREALPLEPGYEQVRRPIYQLYYLLVHVNLFGGAYVSQANAVLQTALGAL
ncbi:MAG TPA: fructosamine kinase family protein [Longimicrobiaceae bacterium]|nr:fructosamine kinase family protein [Longimicrobiaceae bacterium]